MNDCGKKGLKKYTVLPLGIEGPVWRLSHAGPLECTGLAGYQLSTRLLEAFSAFLLCSDHRRRANGGISLIT